MCTYNVCTRVYETRLAIVLSIRRTGLPVVTYRRGALRWPRSEKSDDMTKVTIKNTGSRRFVEYGVTCVKHNCVLRLRRKNKTKGPSRNVKRVAVRGERGKTACLQMGRKHLRGTRRVDGAKRFFVKMPGRFSSVRRRRSAFVLAGSSQRNRNSFRAFSQHTRGARPNHRFD